MSNWTLLSNHGHVLICLSRDPRARLRDVAADVGITERAVQKIVRDLQDAGMVSVTKSGRRNHYRIHQKKSLRHEIEAACTLKDLLKAVNRPAAKTPKEQATERNVSEASQQAVTTEPAADSKAVSPKADSDRSPKAKKGKADKKESAREKIERQQGSLF